MKPRLRIVIGFLVAHDFVSPSHLSNRGNLNFSLGKFKDTYRLHSDMFLVSLYSQCIIQNAAEKQVIIKTTVISSNTVFTKL